MTRLLSLALLAPFALAYVRPQPSAPAGRQWTQTTYLDFAGGRLGDGGANTHIAADGSVRLVNRWDLNNDGYLDLVFPSSHDNNHGVDSYVYSGKTSGFDPARRTRLPGNGASGSAIADLNRDGFPDVVLTNEFNGTKTELHSFIYWGSRTGLAPDRRTDSPPWRLRRSQSGTLIVTASPSWYSHPAGAPTSSRKPAATFSS